MALFKLIHEAEKLSPTLDRKLATFTVFTDDVSRLLFKFRIKKFSTIKEALIPIMCQELNDVTRLEFQFIKKENIDAISIFFFVLHNVEDINFENIVKRFPEIFDVLYKINQELKFKY